MERSQNNTFYLVLHILQSEQSKRLKRHASYDLSSKISVQPKGIHLRSCKYLMQTSHPPKQKHLIVNSAHVHGKIHKTVRISPLIIIPRNDLVEGIIECNASGGIHNRRSTIMDKVLRHHLMFGVSEDTLQLSLRRSLESGKHLLGSASLL